MKKHCVVRTSVSRSTGYTFIYLFDMNIIHEYAQKEIKKEKITSTQCISHKIYLTAT